MRTVTFCPYTEFEKLLEEFVKEVAVNESKDGFARQRLLYEGFKKYELTKNRPLTAEEEQDVDRIYDSTPEHWFLNSWQLEDFNENVICLGALDCRYEGSESWVVNYGTRTHDTLSFFTALYNQAGHKILNVHHLKI